MESSFFALKLIAVFISLTGVMLFANDRLKLNSAFTPLFAVSVVSLLVYIAGCIGFLGEAAVTVWLAGLVLFVYEAARMILKKYSAAEFFTSPGIIVFAVFCIFCVFRMKDMLVLHVDNFSHWAVIIKEMCVTDSFPLEGTAVSFRNYTPGSAVFSYFLCRNSMYSEGVALIAHGTIISASFSALFCKLRFKNVISVIALFVLSIVTFVIPELSAASLGIYNFLTDGLISYVAVACIVIAYVYRKESLRLGITLIPMVSYLTILKSSARVFAIIIAALVLCLWSKHLVHPVKEWKRDRAALVGKVVCLILLIVMQLITPHTWNMYTEAQFPEYIDKFPSGVSGVMDTISEKEPGYLKNIAQMMFEQSFDYSETTETVITAAWIFAVIVLICSLFAKKNRSFIIGGILFTLICQIIYTAELFILYGFIFDPSEAEILASFYRYFSTGSILVTLLLVTICTYQLKYIGENSRIAVKIALSLLSLIFCTVSVVIVREQIYQLYDPLYRDYTATYAEQREEHIALYSKLTPYIPRDSSITVYSENKNFFARTVVRHEFLTGHCGVRSTADVADTALLEGQLNVRDFFVIDTGDMATLITSAESLGYTFINPDAKLFAVDAEAKTLTGIYVPELEEAK